MPNEITQSQKRYCTFHLREVPSVTESERQEVEWWLPGTGEEEMGSYLASIRVQIYKTTGVLETGRTTM